MSYLVKASAEAYGNISPGHTVYWRSGETRWVEDECIAYYKNHSDVFTVLEGPDLQENRYRTTYTIVADDVTAGAITFTIPFTATGFLLQVRDATGLQRAVTDLVTLSDGDIVLTADGATTFAATDVVHLIAWA